MIGRLIGITAKLRLMYQGIIQNRVFMGIFSLVVIAVMLFAGIAPKELIWQYVTFAIMMLAVTPIFIFQRLWHIRRLLDENNLSIIFFEIIVFVLSIVLFYAFLYRLLVEVNPQSFKDARSLSSIDALYYSIYTLTDYGTLQPVTTLAKIVVMLQMVTTFFIGTFVIGVITSAFLQPRETTRK